MVRGEGINEKKSLNNEIKQNKNILQFHFRRKITAQSLAESDVQEYTMDDFKSCMLEFLKQQEKQLEDLKQQEKTTTRRFKKAP